MLVDANGFSGDLGVGVKMGTPIAVTDDRDGKGPGLVAIFQWEKNATLLGSDAEDGEEVSRNQFTPDALGVVLLADAEGRGSSHRDAVEEFEMVAEIAVVGVGVGHDLAVRCDRLERNQAAGIGDTGKRAHEDSVDPTKDRRGGADADGERDHCDGREGGISRHHAQAIAKVLHEAFAPGQGGAFAISLLRRHNATKLEDRLAAGLLGCHAGAEIVLDVHLEMAFELRLQIGLAVRVAEETEYSNPESAQVLHGVSYSERRACMGLMRAALRAGK